MLLKIHFFALVEATNEYRIYVSIKQPSFMFANGDLQKQVEKKLTSRFGQPVGESKQHIYELTTVDAYMKKYRTRYKPSSASCLPFCGHLTLTTAQVAEDLLREHHIVSP
jgi:hypothetical protein